MHELNYHMKFSKHFTRAKGLYPIFNELLQLINEKIQSGDITLTQARNMDFSLDYQMYYGSNTGKNLVLSATVTDKLSGFDYDFHVTHVMNMKEYKKHNYQQAITTTNYRHDIWDVAGDDYCMVPHYPIKKYPEDIVKAECQVFMIYYDIEESQDQSDINNHFDLDFAERNLTKNRNVVYEYNSRLRSIVHNLTSQSNKIIDKVTKTVDQLFGSFDDLMINDISQDNPLSDVYVMLSTNDSAIDLYFVFNTKGQITECTLNTEIDAFDQSKFDLLKRVMEILENVQKGSSNDE